MVKEEGGGVRLPRLKSWLSHLEAGFRWTRDFPLQATFLVVQVGITALTSSSYFKDGAHRGAWHTRTDPPLLARCCRHSCSTLPALSGTSEALAKQVRPLPTQ